MIAKESDKRYVKEHRVEHQGSRQSSGGAIAAALTIAIVVLLSGRTDAAGLSVPVGLVFENNFYHQFGVRASVAHDMLLGGHPRLSVSYTTSRLSAYAGRNVLKKDNVLFNAGWYFRPGRLIDPYAGIDAGFTRYNRENDELFALLDNRSGLLNVRAGLTSSLLGGRIRPTLDGGLAILSLIGSASSTEFPLFFSIGVDFDIAKGVLP
jgi:hypothetical protein